MSKAAMLAFNNSNCALAAPTAEKYWKTLTLEYEMFITLSVIFCLAIIILFLGKIYFIFHYVSSYRRAGFMIWLCAIFPITAIVCTVSIAIPRAMPISNMFIFLYFARSLFTFVELVIDYFGGRVEMARELAGRDIKTNIPPFCCCCPCLPTLKPSPYNLRRLAIFVYQTALINPAIYFVMAVVWTDQIGNVQREKPSMLSWFMPLLSLCSFLSVMMAMYGINLYARMSAGVLQGYCLKAQVRFMQIMLLCFNFQNYIFTMVSSFDLIGCDEVLPITAKAAMYDRFTLIIESFILSMASSFFLRPSINSTFDLHPARSMYRQRKPAFSISDPRPLRLVRGSSVAETISDALAYQEAIPSYYYCDDPELGEIQDQKKAKGGDYPVRKRSVSTNSSGAYFQRKITPMPGQMSAASSPGLPLGAMGGIRINISAPDSDPTSKRSNLHRHRIPDSILETDEDGLDDQPLTDDEMDRSVSESTASRIKTPSVLDDDVFVETDNEDDRKKIESPPPKKSGMYLTVDKLQRYLKK